MNDHCAINGLIYIGYLGSSELLRRSKSQILEVNARTYRQNAGGSRKCQLCGSGEEENMYHVIVECVGYTKAAYTS